MGFVSLLVCAIGILFTIFGLLIFLVGLLNLLHTCRLLLFGNRATAQVIQYQADVERIGTRPDGGELHLTFYIPRLEFQDEHGELHVAEATGLRKKRFRVGEEVSVLYFPERPETCLADHFFDKWISPSILLALGGILVVVGLINAIVFARRFSGH